MATDWIAAAGLRLYDPDATTTLIPDDVMQDPDLSLIARGLYAGLLVEQGRPIDPYENGLDDDGELAAAVEELIQAGLAVRVAR
jgi:hypothetical protein